MIYKQNILIEVAVDSYYLEVWGTIFMCSNDLKLEFKLELHSNLFQLRVIKTKVFQLHSLSSKANLYVSLTWI